MKKWIIFGGLVGFATGAITGFQQGLSAPTAVMRACLAALAAGLLTKWWARILFQSFRTATQEKAAEAVRRAKQASQMQPQH